MKDMAKMAQLKGLLIVLVSLFRMQWILKAHQKLSALDLILLKTESSSISLTTYEFFLLFLLTFQYTLLVI